MMIDDFSKVREAKVRDAERLAAVFAESWRVAYRGIIPNPQLESLIRRRGPSWWKTNARQPDGPLVLIAGGVIAGYATFGPSRFSGGGQGEIYELYLMPVYQGLGLGAQLFESSRYHLDMRGLDGLIVWALSENTIATDVYLRRGGLPKFQSTETFGTRVVEKTGFVWK